MHITKFPLFFTRIGVIMEFICTDCPRLCGARRGDDNPAGYVLGREQPKEFEPK